MIIAQKKGGAIMKKLASSIVVGIILIGSLSFSPSIHASSNNEKISDGGGTAPPKCNSKGQCQGRG